MSESATGQKVTINGVEYAADQLSAEARNQVVNIKACDQEIARLQQLLAITQTARMAYSTALRNALPPGNEVVSH